VKVHKTSRDPLRVHRMNLKIRFRELTGWRLKNDEERMENDEERWRISQESLTKAPRLGFSSRKHIFSPKTAEMHSKEVRNILKQPLPSPIYSGKGRCLPPKGFLMKVSKRTPITKFTPFSYFTEKLWKPYGSILDLIFIFFSVPFHQC